jgi:hypothetical protein
VFRSKGAAALTVYAFRKDGFDGNIKLTLKEPAEDFISPGAVLPASKDFIRGAVRTTLTKTKQPLNLVIEGRAMVGDQELVRKAVPAEDMMQAFLWRHLVPAQDLPAFVYDPNAPAQPKRVPKPPSAAVLAKIEAAKQDAGPVKFTQRQVTGRLRQLKLLYEAELLSDDFYHLKVAECEASL